MLLVAFGCDIVGQGRLILSPQRSSNGQATDKRLKDGFGLRYRIKPRTQRQSMPRDRVTKTEMARRAFFEVATWKARATLTSRSTLLSARSKLLSHFLIDLHRGRGRRRDVTRWPSMPRAIYSPGRGTRLLQRGTVVQNPSWGLNRRPI